MSHKQHLVVMFAGATLLFAILACNVPPFDPANACPQAGDDKLAYINQEAGFCFLYPEELTPNGTTTDYVSLHGSPLPPNSREPAAVFITVTYTGPAVYVSDSAEYASMWMDTIVAQFPGRPRPEPITINNQQAAVIRGLHARFSPYRIAFIVVNGYQYTLSLDPDIGTSAELDPLAQETWDTVTGSIVFFTPTLAKEVVKADDVCPKATADSQLSVEWGSGVCFLVPVDATPAPMVAGAFQIGPTDTHPDFPEVRVGLAVGAMGPGFGKTSPRDAVHGLLSSGVDPSAIQDVTIGGKPAITFLDTDPPWIDRTAVVVANDMVYTISMNPYDQQQYPAMIPDADRLWNTVIGSLTFFTPFE